MIVDHLSEIEPEAEDRHTRDLASLEVINLASESTTKSHGGCQQTFSASDACNYVDLLRQHAGSQVTGIANSLEHVGLRNEVSQRAAIDQSARGSL